MKQRYIQECSNCGNVVVGREKRGFVRDALHGGPGTAVEEQEENKLQIHLDMIEQIQGTLAKIEILDITVDEVNANVAFKV